MQKQDFYELFLSQSHKHQTAFMSVNKTTQMCRGFFLLPDIQTLGWESGKNHQLSAGIKRACTLQRDEPQLLSKYIMYLMTALYK